MKWNMENANECLTLHVSTWFNLTAFFGQIKDAERYTVHVTTLEKCVYFGAYRCVIKV